MIDAPNRCICGNEAPAGQCPHCDRVACPGMDGNCTRCRAIGLPEPKPAPKDKGGRRFWGRKS